VIGAIVEAGKFAALIKKDANSVSPPAYAGKLTVHLNKLGRAPPPISFDLKLSIPKVAMD
jgi:hypothetical protein